MSKKQGNEFLRFGQGILIEGFKAVGDDRGLLTAKGFADVKAKYETYDDILYFKNYRNGIFQILPAGNFELSDQLKKSLADNEGQKDTPNILILKARAKSEHIQFDLNIANKVKDPVCFGTSVIFKHIDSESYISGTIKPSNGSNGAFTVEVSTSLSDSMVFQLLPYRSFEFSGMPIPFDSPIMIKNVYNNGYLTFEKLGLREKSHFRGTYIEKKPIESNDSYRIPVKTRSLKSNIYEVVTHFVDLSCQKDKPMPWRLVLHVDELENDEIIQHDVVYFKHTQNNGILSVSNETVVLKELKPGNDPNSFFKCLWQIEKHPTAGPHACILRHLMSGRTLGVQQEGDRIVPVLHDISAGAEGGVLGHVDIKLAKKQGGIINSNSFVNILSDELILQIDDEFFEMHESIRKQKSSLYNSELVDRCRMAKIYQKSIEYDIKKLVFKHNESQKHCFVIMEIEDELKKQLLFAFSFHSVIIDLREDLQWGAIQASKEISYLRMMQVTEKIKEIKTFIKGCIPQESQFDNIFPIENRQNLCKDLGLSELLFQLLYFMRMNFKEDIFVDKHNEREKFLQMYNTLYDVIKEMIRGNQLFKMHVSKWFAYVLQDVIDGQLIPDHPDGCYLALMKELLQENSFFLQNFVSTRLVSYISDCFDLAHHKEFTEIKYLQIFRVFCINTDEKVYTCNQTIVLQSFYLRMKQAGSVFFISFLQGKDGLVHVRAAVDKQNFITLPFKKFYELCSRDHPTAWTYFVQFIKLIGSLAIARNMITEQVLKTDYPVLILSRLYEYQDLHQAEEPILRLIHYLYAQSDDFYPIERCRKVFSYEALIQGQISFLSCTEQAKKKFYFETILARMLEKCKEYGPLFVDNVDSNKTLLTMLRMLTESFRLGFLYARQRIQEILLLVLRLLECKDQDYFPVSESSFKNSLLISCKYQCLKIMDYIADLDVDVFLQIVTIRFQRFKLPERKFTMKGVFNANSIFFKKSNPELVVQFLQQLPDDKHLNPLLPASVCERMMAISQHENHRLTSKALLIMQRVLQTRRQALQSFSEVIIIADEQRLQMWRFIESHRCKFFLLQDHNLTGQVNSQQSKNQRHSKEQDAEKLSVMETLYLFTQLMKNENSILKTKDIKNIYDSKRLMALATDRLLNFTSERSSTNRMKQEIVYVSRLHEKVLVYISNCKQYPTQQLSIKLLHLCYHFIVSLIENFNKVKSELKEYLPSMMVHLEHNIGCLDLLKQMYDNNKVMLYNQSAVFELIKLICKYLQNEPRTSYYRSKLLDFFRYLIYCNGRTLRKHQIQILKIMQDDTYHNIMINPTVEYIKHLVDQYDKGNACYHHEGRRMHPEVDGKSKELLDKPVMERDLRESNSSDSHSHSRECLSKESAEFVMMSPDLTYLCTYFQILSSLIDDNNSVNIGKIIRRFSFDTLVSFIRESGECWPLKRNLRALLNRLYYFRPEIQTQLKTIISEQLDNIINDLDNFIQSKSRQDICQHERREFFNPVRFSYVQSYHYLFMEECIFTVCQLLTQEGVYNEIVKHLLGACQKIPQDLTAGYNIVCIAERLAWLQKYFISNQNSYSNSMIKFVMAKMRCLLDTINVPALYSEGLSPYDRMHPRESQQFKAAKSMLIQKLMRGGIDQFYQKKKISSKSKKSSKQMSSPKPSSQPHHKHHKNIPITYLIKADEKAQQKPRREKDHHRLVELLTRIFKKKKKGYKSDNERLSCELEQVVSAIKLSDQAESYFVQEYTEKMQPYTSNSQIYDYVARIIKLNSVSPTALSPGSEAFFLQLITKLVQQANQGQQSTARSIDEWQPQDWQGNAQQIIQVQNKLRGCGLGRFLIDLLKQDLTNHIALADAILLCGIVYLLGGNSYTQKNMIEQLQQDSDNKVFLNLQCLITRLGKLIRNNIEQSSSQSKEQFQFALTTIDNYDYYDQHLRYTMRKNVSEPNTTDEYLQVKLCIRTFRRAFKLLQLLCENNNIQGKHLIREQPNNTRAVNFIHISTRELRDLFQVYCSEISQVPLFLLNFVLEVTQIPVAENQADLMNSMLFEDLCHMNAFFLQPGNLEHRGFVDNQDLQAIYFLAIKIILSNFEGNNPKTYTLLDAKIDPKTLIGLLESKIISMGIKNRYDLLQYIQKYSNETDNNGKKNVSFDENIMCLLDILSIFLKLRDVLGKEKSRNFSAYERFKRDFHQKHRQQVFVKLIEQGVDEEVAAYEAEQQMGSYNCIYGYLQRSLLSIEVNDHTSQKQTIYFPRYPVFNSLSSNLRSFIMQQVKRDTHRDKIVSLLSYTSAVSQKMEYSYNLLKEEHIQQANMTNTYWWASRISIVLCIFMLLTSEVIIQYGKAQFTSNYPVAAVRFFLSLCQLTFSVLHVFYWYKLKIWYDPEPKPREPDNPMVQVQAKQEQPDIPRTWWQRTKELAFSEQQQMHKSLQFWRLAILLGSSIIGTFYYPPIFFLHLIDSFAQKDQLGAILSSVVFSFRSLAWVSLMGVIFVVIFCAVSFSNYMKNVYPDGDEEMCEGLLNCVMSLYVSGVIGETMDTFEGARFIYDLIYVTFFSLLFGNIVSGIMLDAFASLREAAELLKNDKLNRCYICDVQRQTLQNQKMETFESHTRRHYLWNYLFYIYVLERKNQTDYTGLQYYIATKYRLPDEEIDVSWLPSCGHSEFDVAEEAASLNSYLKSSMSTIDSQINSLKANIEEFNRIMGTLEE